MVRLSRTAPVLLLLVITRSAGATPPCSLGPDPTIWQRDESRVTSAAAVLVQPLVLADPAGGAEVVWNDSRYYGESPIYSKHIQTERFGAEQRLSYATGEGSPNLVQAPERSFLAVWSDARDVDIDVFVQRWHFGGGNSPSFPFGGIAVCTAPGRQSDPTVALDGHGGFYVAWVDERYGLLTSSDIYIQRFHDYGQVWEGWPVNGIPVTASPGDQIDPIVVSDGAGGALVVFRDASDPFDHNLFLARISSDGVVPNGWENGRQMTLSTADAGAPMVLPDPAGGAFIAWEEVTVRGADPEMGIRLARVDGAGEPVTGWPLEGKSIAAVFGVTGTPTLAADGTGGVFIGWVEDPTLGESEAKVSHIEMTGLRGSGWPAAGRILGTALEGISSVPLLGDNGSVIAAWTAAEGDGDIRALRLDFNGNASTSWPPEGVVMTAAPGSQRFETVRAREPVSGSIVSDGAGGAIVLWLDFRDGPAAIYAQRVGRNGAVPPRTWWIPCDPKGRWITRAYPTPTRGAITIEAFAPNDHAVRFEIYDVRGRLRHVTRAGAAPGPAVLPFQLDLSSLEPGVYFVRYEEEGDHANPRGSRRIVVTR